MHYELLTRADLEEFRSSLIEEIKGILNEKPQQEKWLKTREVMNQLKCSVGKLQTLKKSGLLEYTKVQGTIYYAADSIIKLMHGKGEYDKKYFNN